MNANNDGEAVPGLEGLRVLDEDHARGLRGEPRIPSRSELDAAYERGEARGWDEQTARAWEYLDSHRDIADERAVATERGDTATIDQLDQRHAALDLNYLGVAREQHAPDITTVDQASPVVVPQDPEWERPPAPDDLDALRARLVALRAQHGPEPRQAGPGRSSATGEDQARRAQLAAWVDDDTRIASSDGRDSRDEDGA